ncbi:MAG: DUF4114 domain-containing protein [Rhodospirillales bacterium]|nr:DUF4114 domain-containing protein [Rhodospirillales bacterium]MCB9997080.1 DUF4114 domain-containing protein [Rhodospirillales bacterium]
MADINGTNGNDVFFFQGNEEHLTLTFTNPFSGITYSIDDDKNVNSASYEGLAGIDTIFMTNLGDAIFLRNHNNGDRMVSNVEVFFAGDGGDVIHLADTEYALGDTTIDGGASEDIILANIGDDLLNGREGDDILDGGPGNDWLNGGNGTGNNTGNDWISGGADADYLNGEDGNDTLVFFVDGAFTADFLGYNIGSPGVPGTATFVAVAGSNLSLDIFDGGTGFDTLVMTDGDDTFFLDDPYHDYHPNGSSLRLIDVERIDAGDGDDLVDLTHDTISYGDIIISGGAGNDHLWSSVGDDLINGEDGDDHLFGGFGDDELNGGDGADEIYGSLGNDLLRGGIGNDTLYGGASSNSQYVIISEQSHSFTNNVVFPNLMERVDIMDLVPPGDNALGIAAGDLSVDFSTTAEVSFIRTEAGYNNSLGFYNIGLDGTIMSVELAFPNVKDYNAGDSATINLPGAPDTDFGFFIIANGARKNNDYNQYDLENGEFKFIYHHGQGDERLANISDNENDIKLVFYDSATEKVVVGSNNHIYHTTTRGGSNNLNSDGQTHVVSGIMDGSDGSTLRIGFEDLPNLGDADYNDVVFDITVQTQTTVTVLEDDVDILLGGAGDDFLDGGIGNDVLVGGVGMDMLYGDQGADLFLFQSIADAGDTIFDFDAGEGDIINVTDVLEGFDAGLDDVNDFMQLVNSGGDTVLEVNADGQGNDFVALATFDGGLGGATLADLLADGSLVVDQSIPV